MQLQTVFYSGLYKKCPWMLNRRHQREVIAYRKCLNPRVLISNSKHADISHKIHCAVSAWLLETKWFLVFRVFIFQGCVTALPIIKVKNALLGFLWRLHLQYLMWFFLVTAFLNSTDCIMSTTVWIITVNLPRSKQRMIKIMKTIVNCHCKSSELLSLPKYWLSPLEHNSYVT